MNKLNNNNAYNEDSIESLGILGGVRAKPSSIGLESHSHTLLEILMNSIDEAKAGYGNKIIVTKYKDKSVSIEDFGRSLPMAKNSKGVYAYKKIFEELWAGGKYKNNSKNSDGNYKWSCGTNGMGVFGSCGTADFLEATAYAPNNKQYHVRYEKGIQVGEFEETIHDKKSTGTLIHWIPSKEVFKGDNDITHEFIESTLKQQSIINGGIYFVLNDEERETEQTFYYENGAVDYIKEITENEQSLSEVINWSTIGEGRENTDDEEYAIKSNISFVFSNTFHLMECYHNSSFLENGGTPQDFIKNGFTYAINKYINDNNMNTKRTKITFEDILDSLVIVSDTYSTISLYTDQAKKKIESKFMKKYVTDFIKDKLETYFTENKLEAERICNQILINSKARINADKTKANIKKKLSEKVDIFNNRIEGLVDSKIHGEEAELYITEGLSALGGMVLSRDPNFQAGMPIRGKILNCLKASYEQIFKSPIITNLIKVIGCGIECDKKNKDLGNFNIDNLRYGKIICLCDEDADARNIVALILTMFYRLMPQLIHQGRIYVAKTPLFEIRNTDTDEMIYAYSDAEKDNIIKNIRHYKISRNKGIGENDSHVLAETAMNPKTRHITQVKIEDVEEMAKSFEVWMDTEVKDRKEYIENHLNEYLIED